jgi:hypothetical protein
VRRRRSRMETPMKRIHKTTTNTKIMRTVKGGKRRRRSKRIIEQKQRASAGKIRDG